MNKVILPRFQTELEEIRNQFKKDTQFKKTSYDELITIPMNMLDWQLCPALVLAVCSVGDLSNKNVLNMASVVQCVFMSNRIHRMVTDGKLPDHSRQYSVLIGDYLLAQTFLKLSESSLFCYSGEFVQLIKTMNEGVVTRWRLRNSEISTEEYQGILGKEKASITALAGKVASHMCGMQKSQIRAFEELGYQLGMTWAAWEESLNTHVLQKNIKELNSSMTYLRNNLWIEPIQDLYYHFSKYINLNSNKIELSLTFG